MYVTWQTVVAFVSLMSALGVLLGFVLKVHKWYLEQQRLKKEMAETKEENALICFALSACLDGLQQLGANHTVPVAKERLDKFLNKRAHE